MRRMKFGMIPAVLLVAGVSSVSAQTRTAPSIGDAVRRAPASTVRQPGVSARGVNLPAEQYCGRDDRNDRDDRYDRDDRKDRRDRDDSDRNRRSDDRYDRDRNGNSSSYGCCADNGNRNDRDSRESRVSQGRNTGRGTLDVGRGTTGTSGRVNQSGSNGRNDGCGYYDPRSNQRQNDNRQGDRRDRR